MKLEITAFKSHLPGISDPGGVVHYEGGRTWYTDERGVEIERPDFKSLPWEKFHLELFSGTDRVLDLEVSITIVVQFVEHLKRVYPQWFQAVLDKQNT